MRFSDLFIDSYGIFRNATLVDLPQGLVPILGDNETGKSTLLAFIRAILFGFPTRSAADYHPVPDGGTPAGRVRIVTSDGDAFTVWREGNKKGGAVSVTYADGSTGDADALARRLGGATADLFRSVYAFSLSELQDIKTLQGDAVKNALYGASLGMSAKTFPAAKSAIEKRMGALFRKGARSDAANPPVIVRIVAELKRVREDLRVARDALGTYDQAQARLAELERAIEELRRRCDERRTDTRRVGIDLGLWDDWVQLGILERDLDALPEQVAAFPENAFERFKEIDARLEEKRGQLEDAEAELEQRRRDLDGLRVDDALLERADEIAWMTQERNAYIERRRQEPANRQESGRFREEIRDLLAGLGADWDEARLASIDKTVFARDAIERHRADLDNAISAARLAEEQVKNREEALEEAVRRERAANDALEALGSPAPQVDETVVRELQQRRSEFANAVQDLPGVREERARSLKELNRILKEISPDWRADDVANFDTSAGAQETTAGFQRRLDAAERSVREAASALENAGRALDKATDKKERAERERADFAAAGDTTFADVDERRRDLRALRNAMSAAHDSEVALDAIETRLVEEKRREDERRKGTAARPALGYVAAALVLLGAAAVFFLIGQPMPGIVSLVAGGVVLGLRFLPTTPAAAPLDVSVEAIERQRDAARDAFESELRQLEDLARAAGLAGRPSSSDVERLDDRLREADHRAAKRESVQARWRECDEDLRRAEQEHERCRELLAAAKTESDRAIEQWRAYLIALRLPPSSDPNVAGRAFEKAGAARSKLDEIGRTDARINRMEKARAEYRRLAEATPIAQAAQKPDKEFLAQVDRLFEDIEEAKELRVERCGAEEQLAEEKRRRLEAQRARDEARTGRDEADARHEECLRRWRSCLDACALPNDLSPDSAIKALDIAEKCLQRIRERDTLESRIEREAQAVAAYEERAKRLFDALGRETPKPDALAVTMDRLASELDDNKETKARAEQTAKVIEARDAQVLRLRGEKERLDTQQRALFAEAGVEDEEAFHRRGALFMQRSQILAGIAQHEKNLLMRSGETDPDAVRRRLAATDRERLENEQTRIAQDLRETEQDLERLRNELAEVRQRIKALQSADDVARLRMREETLIAEARDAADEWRRYASAAWLLEDACKRFERDRQPGVIRDASEIFRTITGGAYAQVFAPIGENAIEVIAPDDKRKKPEELSRGTAEQLYLALRFGYIRHRAKETEPLPVVMDDILVNFDPKRARRAAEAILDLARSHQILFFTCHPETLHLFQELDPDIFLRRIQNGAFLSPDT